MAYTQPDAAALKLRFPAFAAVDDVVIEYWLEDSRLIVTDSWAEDDRAPGEMELAAHNMAALGFDRTTGDAIGGLAQMGVTSFRSASMSVNFDPTTIQNANSSNYRSTKYGQLFLARLRRNVGGPRLVGCA